MPLKEKIAEPLTATGTASALHFAPLAPTILPFSEAERHVAELRDAANRRQDTIENLTACGLIGGDTLAHRAARTGVTLDGRGEAAYLVDAAQHDTKGGLRVDRRTLGVDYGLPVPLGEIQATPAPSPKGGHRPETAPALDLGQWFRKTAPDGDWRQLGTIAANGVEVCFRCQGRVREGRRLSILAHDANDLVIHTCLPCAAKLQDRPLAEDETPEHRTRSTYDMELSLAQLQDARLWRFSADRTFAVLDLGEDYRVNILRKRDSYPELSINFPDMIDCAKVVGYYRTIEEVHQAALDEVTRWSKG